MKPFTRVPQPKEVASITWKRGEKSESSLLIAPASYRARKLPLRRCRAVSCSGTLPSVPREAGHAAAPGPAEAAPAEPTRDRPPIPPAPSRERLLRHRAEHTRDGRPGPPTRHRGGSATSARPLGSSASRPLRTRFSLSMAPHPARPDGRPECPALPFLSLPSLGTTSPGSHRAHLHAAGRGRPAGRREDCWGM